MTYLRVQVNVAKGIEFNGRVNCSSTLIFAVYSYFLWGWGWIEGAEAEEFRGNLNFEIRSLLNLRSQTTAIPTQ